MTIDTGLLIAASTAVAAAASVIGATAWQTRHQGKKLHAMANDIADVKLLRHEVGDLQRDFSRVERQVTRVERIVWRMAGAAGVDVPSEGGE